MNLEHECARCGRKLKSAKAIEAGMGKVCKRKSQEEKEEREQQQAEQRKAE